MITLQYLEPGSHISGISLQVARDKLRAALDILPVDCLLLGWDLSSSLIDVCREETSRACVKLYRWHPLLTGDGTFIPEAEWQTRNSRGEPLPGFRGLPEFTFVCPNNPVAREAALAHLADLSRSGLYDGFFLDRMRYPSPTADPPGRLSCFCEHCRSAASDFGLDWEAVRQSLLQPDYLFLLDILCGAKPDNHPLATFLDFRQQTITAYLRTAIGILRASALEVGLDCFSPSLTRMVGQDLAALAPLADWTKLMMYGHARGPATLPYEIGGLLDWLIVAGGTSKPEAIAYICEVLSLPLSASRSMLLETGLSPESLVEEYRRGRMSSDHGLLLAGIELVEIPDVSELNKTQIESDLVALKAAGVDGLSLSWDLWRMPLDRLALVAQIWEAD